MFSITVTVLNFYKRKNEDENHDRQENSKHLTKWIFYIFESVSRNEHQQTAEKCENKNTQQVVIEFCFTERSGFFLDDTDSCMGYHQCRDCSSA